MNKKARNRKVVYPKTFKCLCCEGGKNEREHTPIPQPRIKRLWLKHLRSGRFRQGRGLLCQARLNSRGRYVYQFCCLGVLCNLGRNARKSWILGFSTDMDGVTVPAYSYETGEDNGLSCQEDTVLPRRIRDFLNMDEETMNHLVEMNDAGMSFHQIANWIERYL